MKRNVVFGACVLAAVLSWQAYATSTHIPRNGPSTSSANCIQENIRLDVSFNFEGLKVETLLAQLEKIKSDVQKVAKATGVEAKVQSENYNVTSQVEDKNRRPSTLHGNMAYQVKPYGKAMSFFKGLSESNIQATMNYSMNNSCLR